MKEQLLKMITRLRGFFPSRLPQGVSDFTNLVDRLLANYTLPTSDRTSIEFGVAATILHLGETTDSKPDYYFVRILRASAAKQVSSHMFQTIKMKQMEASQTAKAVEAAPENVQETKQPGV